MQQLPGVNHRALETLFISDLHLSPERPGKLRQFIQLLRGPARRAKAVYILGDLFEQFWVGNDDKTPPNPEIINELLNFSENGGRLYFIKGNRELILDKHFEAITGCTVLPDQAVINLEGNRILLMHGDLLCTRDRIYQAYRRFVTTPIIKKCFDMLPYRVRILLSHGLRPMIRRSMMQKPEDIMDVEQATVETIMRSHNTTELMHGHTHRPGTHEFELAGRPAKRIVLGDWYDTDMILVCEENRRQLMAVSEYLLNSANSV